MKLTFLGSGTSTGVPQIMCGCSTCRSTDPRDKRLRASAVVTLDDGRNLLIDCGPDFRAQALASGLQSLAAVLVTHSHYDHVGGFDDLRPFCHRTEGGMDVYCQRDVAFNLRDMLPYCFKANPYPGVPSYNIHIVSPLMPFAVGGDIRVVPLPVMHYKLPILGYRIGPLAYVTDCKTMPPETVEALRGVDTLVINALRHKPHLSHMNLRQALDVINTVAPRRAYLTHLSHDMGLHADVEPTLPLGVKIAFDGLTIDIDN